MSTHKIDACGCRPDRGHSHARVFTKPLRELTPDTTEGFRAIRLATLLGLRLLPWQRWLLLHALELLPDGKLRFGTVVVIVSRQNGKSTLSCVWFLWQLFVMKTKFCAGIAQNLDTAKEIWESVCEMVLSRGALRKQMKGDVVRTNGQLALRLTGGRRYRPFSVERGVARGLSFGAVLIDEIQYHRNFDMWSSVSKTVLAVPNSQVMALGTAGDDRSVVLAQLRGSAMAALDEGRTDTTLGLFEFSAEPGREIGDFEGWREANPAGGYTIPWSGIMGAMEKDPPAVFRTECLGLGGQGGRLDKGRQVA
jgi:phage terminase large subunit-like protein